MLDSTMNKDAKARDHWPLATAVLLALQLLLVLSTFSDYGITWDEKSASTNGELFLRWYATGFQDSSVIDDGNQRLYGSLFNGISRLVSEHSTLGIYETGHLLIALTGWVGLLLAYRLAKLVAGTRAGFFSALMLFLTPGWYGHSFNNPKDVPFAVLSLAAVYSLVRAYHSFPRWSAWEMATAGIAIGLALGVRVGAVFLFGYYFLLFVFWCLAKYRSGARDFVGHRFEGVFSVIVCFLGILSIAWTVMLVWWPYAQISPISNPIAAIRASANFSDWPFSVLFGGRFIRSFALPWDYLPAWFAITLPEFYGLAFLAAGGAFVWEVSIRTKESRARTRSESDLDLQSMTAFLGVLILFPMVTAIAMRSILYDAYRHFLFVIPPLACLAGVALSWFLDRPVPRKAKLVVICLVTLSGASTAYDAFRLHPYQSCYFNRSFGGLESAIGRYETDYWGASHKEGLEWLADNYLPANPEASIRVANTSDEFLTEYYVRSRGARTARFVSVALGDSPDVVLSTTRWNRHKKYRGRLLHRVQREGVSLLYVIELVRSDPARKSRRTGGS